MEKKKLIVSTADETITNITDLTFPIIKHFAKQWDADFMVLGRWADEEACPHPKGRIFYRTFRCYDLLNEYSRILHLDADTIISKICPNPFDEFPEDKIAVLYEDKGSRCIDRRNRIRKVQELFGYINHEKNYINTGFLLFSKAHKELFRPHKGKYYTDLGFDCAFYSYKIHELKLPVHEIDYKWNTMSMHCEEWHGSSSRFDSYILHYAGVAGFPDKGSRSRTELIRDDIQEIYGDEFSK